MQDAIADETGEPWHVITAEVPADDVVWAGPEKDDW
jgi:hypothetical protein